MGKVSWDKMKKKYKLRKVIKKWERDIILLRNFYEKDFTGKPKSKEIKEYHIKATIMNPKTGYKLTSMSLNNQRQDTDIIFDIYFWESVGVEPKGKDIILWNGKKYQIDRPVEDNRMTSDFWKGEMIELSKD